MKFIPYLFVGTSVARLTSLRSSYVGVGSNLRLKHHHLRAVSFSTSGFYFTESLLQKMKEDIASYEGGIFPLVTVGKNTKKRSRNDTAPSISKFSNLERKQRKAAVLIPLLNLPSVGACLLFTLRSSSVGTHKGQVSFPGGHIDLEKNETAIEAAMREFHEEVDVQEIVQFHEEVDIQDKVNAIRDQTFKKSTNKTIPTGGYIEIVGVCEEIPAITGTMVTPVIGFITTGQQFQQKEISQISEKKLESNPDRSRILLATSLIDMYGLQHQFPLSETQKSDNIKAASSFSSSSDSNPHVNKEEVAEVFIVPVQDLFSNNRRGEEEMSRFKGHKMAFFAGGEYIPRSTRIWGLTGFLTDVILSKLIKPILRGSVK